VELDALFHNKPDWNDATWEEFRESVREAIEARPEGWICDGNYDKVTDILLAEADTVIWLRLPFFVVYPRLVKRTLRRAVTRELLWGTNRERWRDVLGPQSMLIWGITNWKAHFRKTRARLRSAPPGVRIVVLRSTSEVAGYLAAATK
jgi:adenylate kinase family enzyme